MSFTSIVKNMLGLMSGERSTFPEAMKGEVIPPIRWKSTHHDNCRRRVPTIKVDRE